MQRKSFLKATAVLAGSAFIRLPADGQPLHKKNIIPPYLKPGDTIGITSPSGYITLEKIQPALQQIQNWGFRVKLGKALGTRDGTFGGTDEARVQDFQQMLDDPSIKAILCARGGYGVVRIIDHFDFTQFRKYPKWILGFSDITVFHAHISDNYKVATIHSKMCNSFPDDWASADSLRQQTILSIRDALLGKPMYYQASFDTNNKLGKAQGLLIGGNLRTLENLAGTASDIQTDNKILFLEEVDEQLYNIDRMFWSLKRTGKLEKLAGLIIGGFKTKPEEDPDEKFGLTLEQIVLEKVKEYNYPVCFGFPVGHQVNNFALKCGCLHQLDVAASGTLLSEII